MIDMSYDIICFDCDSTLSTVEGIDELARRAGLFEQVAELTTRAMNGELPLQDVYGHRLQLIKPDRAAIDWLANLYIEHVVPGALETVSELQRRQKQVFIVSGGVRQAILPLAAFLGISEQQVQAVDILFDDAGGYAGFDQQAPAAASGGKAEICRRLNPEGKKIAMIGDGTTDLETQQAGATVIGFGGVVRREAVVAAADEFVEEPTLLAVLDKLI